ncbi:MAG TPA: NIL domain-containing protein [Armatimonadota bacterium]|nr:NIL domain-containing protein [Armatimonadota bacterium]
MASCRVKLTFPADKVREPVIGTLARRFDLMPNIRRARVSEDAGEMVLELDGSDENLRKAMRYLAEMSIAVEPVDGNYLAS